MVEALVIDPFDSNHWSATLKGSDNATTLIFYRLYGTGATIYGGHDLEKWDTVHNVTLESLATGIEETAVLGLITPPGGPPLLSAVGDIGGFYHSDLDTPPDQAFHTPTYGTTNDIDYAGNKPSNIVRSGASSTDPQVALSTDYGITWSADKGFPLSVSPGSVALSADADTVLLVSSSGTLRSQNGSPYTAVATLPSGAAIASDKRNNSIFYGGSDSRLGLSPRLHSIIIAKAHLASMSPLILPRHLQRQ
jgi:xyloglucan-specific exo-beta-1,4-glucanase